MPVTWWNYRIARYIGGTNSWRIARKRKKTAIVGYKFASYGTIATPSPGVGAIVIYEALPFICGALLLHVEYSIYIWSVTLTYGVLHVLVKVRELSPSPIISVEYEHRRYFNWFVVKF